MPTPNFSGARILVLESRRAKEMSAIVSSYGGVAVTAPSMREVPLESNTQAADAADAVIRGEFGLVLLLTGVGTRAWLDAVEKIRGSREPFVDALRRSRVLCRGPKPLAVMRDLNVPVWATAGEPNTWREVLALLDEKLATQAAMPVLEGLRIAVQEYGASNPELLAGLEQRGARITRVPVYQWALPEDLGPLHAGILAVTRGEIDTALFTTATQVVHLLQVADEMGQRDLVLAGLRRSRVASIGPTTSGELRRHGIEPTLEASHPKMGFLVREAAELGR